jgi:2-phosphosulfolactate phosphatase
MDLEVAFLPTLANGWKDKICIVVDVIRASSSIVTILENGADAVYPVHDVDGARRFATEQGFLLCGERNGLPLQGFDCGNSVVELGNMDFRGKGVVLTTTNGTAALEQVAQGNVVLVGCARNATACVEVALNMAVRHEADLGIVCAGGKGRFALDDAVCAGLLADIMLHMSEGGLQFWDSAMAAQTLYQGAPDLLRAFERSASGRRVREIGQADDLQLCASVDASRMVPQVTCSEHLVIRPFA